MASKISVTNADGINNAITIVQFNPVTQLPIKFMGSHNFSLWKAQVSMLICGHNLYGYLDGSIPAPTCTISQNNEDVDNLEFLSWYRPASLKIVSQSQIIFIKFDHFVMNLKLMVHRFQTWNSL